jgi:hypothetical protein
MVAAPVIATTSTIANGAAAPTVTVTGTNFKASIIAADLTVGVGTTGLTLGTVSFVSVMEIRVAFTGTAAAGDVTIQAKTSAFDPAGVSASNTLTVTVPAAAVIDIAVIPGVTAPLTGATPVTTITATAQYTGTVTWDPVAVPFLGSQVYTATITLTPEAGFTLTGVAANFFTVAGATTDTNPINSGVVTAVFPTTADAVINIAAIPGVTAPVTGATPVTTITATAQYTGTVTWDPVAVPFLGSQVYTATITLTPEAGFTLTGVAANFFTVAGATTDTNPINSGVVTAVFPTTADAVINIAAIPGVTAPVTGATPVTTIDATDEYTATIAWNGSPATFAGGTVYTATITLTPKAGYTLTGVTANFFTVAGATATNDANTGVVTAVFPATEAAVINIPAIPGVTAPVTGAVPVAIITATAQYTGTVTWSSTGTFAGSIAYTATITLAPKTGFTLTGVALDFFTVAGTSSPATNAANTGVVTAVFPATLLVVVGASCGGGIVAYILQSGDPGYSANVQHGLIAAAANQSTGVAWSNITTTLVGTTTTAIGTGQANTTAIVLQSGCTSGAAWLCNDLTEGGYTDWYLPSKDELNKLYLNSVAIGGFVSGYYWSSSEYSASSAWYQNFYNGYQYSLIKSFPRRVRAVRAF